MEFNELIEALPSFNVVSTANAAALVAVTFKTAGMAAKPPRKPVGEVLKVL